MLPDPEWVDQLRLLRRHPSLLARQATDQMALERELAGVLVERGQGAEGKDTAGEDAGGQGIAGEDAGGQGAAGEDAGGQGAAGESAGGQGIAGELARLMAATFLAAYRTAGVLWLEGGGERPLPEMVDRLLGRVTLR